MKMILLIFTIVLVSGMVVGIDGIDVIGFTKGRILIYCNKLQERGNEKYFCRESTKQCVSLKADHPKNSWVVKGKFGIIETSKDVRVFFRDLSLGDAGSYQCGEAGVWNYTVNLHVKRDLCCLESETVAGYLGETVTITCPYPEEFQKNIKYFCKQTGQYFNVVINSTESQKGRYSISEDRRSNAVSVRISDVREEDGGVYYCAVGKATPIAYFSLYTELQLQLSGSSITIITVSICVVLLLIGGLTLIFYKLRRSRTEDSAHIRQTSGTDKANDDDDDDEEEDDYENNPLRMQDISMNQASPNPDSTSNQSDSVYQNRNYIANQSDSVYESLDPDINQSDSVYESLDPNTN